MAAAGLSRRSLAGATVFVKVAAVVAVVVAVDWITKRSVESSVIPGEEHSFLPGVELVNTRNHGVAFGLMAGAGVYVTVALAVVVLAVLAYFVRRSRVGLVWLPAGLVVGGALGNVIDRLRDGSVTDFIKLPLGWPPFNVADACITVGVIVLALMMAGGIGTAGDDGAHTTGEGSAGGDSGGGGRIGSAENAGHAPGTGTAGGGGRGGRS